MLRKLNPLTWIAALLDATDARWDAYTKRFEYQGRHWAQGVTA